MIFQKFINGLSVISLFEKNPKVYAIDDVVFVGQKGLWEEMDNNSYEVMKKLGWFVEEDINIWAYNVNNSEDIFKD